MRAMHFLDQAEQLRRIADIDRFDEFGHSETSYSHYGTALTYIRQAYVIASCMFRRETKVNRDRNWGPRAHG
jgi:hypothetical protein